MRLESNNFWIANPALSSMLKLAQEQYPRETGGMLLGYVAEDRSVVVRSIIGPGPNAVHERTGFVPDGAYQQAVLEERFRASAGRETYLGDWHTHPEGDPSLSRLDKRTLARIAGESSSRTAHPVMAILGRGSGDWVLGAVRFVESERRMMFWTKYCVATLNATTY